MDETYSILSWDCCRARNSSFLQRIAALQSPFRGPAVSEHCKYKIIFHPATGLCVLKRSLFKPPELGPCAESGAWAYNPEQTLTLKDTLLCPRAEGAGKSVKLGLFYSESNARWKLISDSKMHLSSKLPNNGSTVCLEVGDDGTVITNPCKCLSRDRTCEADSQWLKIIDSSRELGSKDSFLTLPSQDLNGRFSLHQTLRYHSATI